MEGQHSNISLHQFSKIIKKNGFFTSHSLVSEVRHRSKESGPATYL